MRRLARHLFTLCSAASLLLCVAAGVLWVRSYSHPFLLYYDWLNTAGQIEARSVYCHSDNGAVEITADRTIAHTDHWAKSFMGEPRGWQHFGFSRKPRLQSLRDGFSFRRFLEPGSVSGLTVGVTSVAAPYWFCTLGLATAPVLWLTRRRPWQRADRRRAGLCPQCGYDLRASPERCPECGTRAAK
jgi:hypothetical protein